MLEGRGTTILLGLLAAACGLTGVNAVRPAGSTLSTESGPSSDGRPALSMSVEHGFGQGQISDEAPLDLTKFRPLLAEPEYADVRALVDDGKPQAAALRLAGRTQGAGDEDIGSARRHFLRGFLHREAGDRKSAMSAFESAAKVEWILQEDADLHVAELARADGNPEQALRSLDKLRTLKDSPRALSVRAGCLADQKKFSESAAALRTLLKHSETQQARLELAKVLLASAELLEPGQARKDAAAQAAAQAERARLGLSPDSEIALEAEALLKRAQSSGAPGQITRTVAQELQHLRGLVEERNYDEAAEAAVKIQLPKSPTFSPERCEYDYLVGKVLAGQRKWGEGADRVGPSAEGCTQDKELHSWLLFNAGKYSAADGRQVPAVRYYALLEELHPKSTLADDARLRAAESYKKQGVTARYVSLLSSMPDDYPEGDMTMEGVLTLALYRIERNDWAGAAQVLENGARVVRARDSARGHEYSGTERYFLARARQHLGEEEAALLEYESIVREVPLSYYMLHAYSRLLEASPERAKKALNAGLAKAANSPFEFPHRSEYETAEFARGMELLRVGDTEGGRRVIEKIGLGEGADEALLWGIALLYDRAGDAHTSHGIARGRLTDWFAHYPEGSWQAPWEIGFPRPYHAIVERESRATGVPEWFIYGVMREESTFIADVVSHADAYGLMQVIVPTARGIAKKSGHPHSPAALKRPDVNIAIGSRVLKELARYFRDNPWLAIPGYNAGPGRPKQWLRERPSVDFDVWVEMIPYRETRRYTKRVLASRAAYAFLYYRQEAQTALVLPKRLTPP